MRSNWSKLGMSTINQSISCCVLVSVNRFFLNVLKKALKIDYEILKVTLVVIGLFCKKNNGIFPNVQNVKAYFLHDFNLWSIN
jgi:hypothetical protein